ncbi:MAG: hypothetical protein J5I93_11985 [Pirellulaceae bacterium]|nr:hypothetical protein [Pirellulaceae bacterium]
MSEQLQRQQTRTTPPEASGGDPLQPQPGNLREQAAAFARIAREAHADCERGADAEQQLQRRRNQSGQ